MVILPRHRAWQDNPEPPDHDDEPIDEDCMIEDYHRAMDELHGFYPQPDQHLESQYDEAHGDIEFPF